MQEVKVTLAQSRVGADGAQDRGDEISVTAAEAVRMLAAGQIEQPSAAVMKKLRAAGAPETTDR